jgi:hypothetical protein
MKRRDALCLGGASFLATFCHSDRSEAKRRNLGAFEMHSHRLNADPRLDPTTRRDSASMQYFPQEKGRPVGRPMGLRT